MVEYGSLHDLRQVICYQPSEEWALRRMGLTLFRKSAGKTKVSRETKVPFPWFRQV